MSVQALARTQTTVKPPITPVASGLLQRAAVNNSPIHEVPSIVHEVLRSPGQPLDADTRAFMEPRFGHDFSNVRVHTDTKAAESARAVNAQAYTVGHDITFGVGRFALKVDEGQRLLAHELTHVIQQHGVRPHIQRKSDPQPKSGVYFSFSVKIDSVLSSDQLLLEFIKQYRGVSSDSEAIVLRDKENWHWMGKPPSIKQTDVDKGYILIPVDDLSITPGTEAGKKKRGEYFKSLASEEQEAINAEVDREFWEKTHYGVGQKLGTSTDDKRMAEYWKVLRDELIRKRQAIDALLPDIQKFLFDPEAPTNLNPKDFEAALRIASKVVALTPAELAEYKSRVTVKTTDWSVYEASIDRFLAERKEREATAREKQTIETRLYNLDTLYDRYRSYVSMLKTNATLGALGANNPQAAGAALGEQPTLNRMRAELDADLIKAGFPGGITDFEKLIKDYEQVFERETLAIANVMLDQYAHVLYMEETKYQDLQAAKSLYQQIGQTQAKQFYQEAEEQTISAWRSAPPAGAGGPQPQVEARLAEAAQTRRRAESAVAGAAMGHPLVQNNDFDRKKLARAASPSEVQSLMLAYIAARKSDIATTRRDLANKPTMIYGLDVLLNASLQSQNIQPGTIRDKIIHNHISDVHWEEAIPQIVLAIIAVAAGLFTGGTGTVAVLAAGTMLGISAYQAIEAFRNYEMKSAAYGAQLTSNDPSMVWVIVAVIGAGIDAAAFGSVLSKVPELRLAINSFNAGPEAGNVAALEGKLAKLTNVEEDIRKSIIRAADAEAEARAAWKSIFRPPGALRMVIIPGAEEFGRLVYAGYRSFVSGVRDFEVFLKTREAIDLIGDITKLTAEELAALKTGYLTAIEEMEAVAAHGKALGMNDVEIEAFMKLRGETKGMTVDQVAKEMDAWKVTAQGGLPTKPLGKSSLIVDENVMIALEKQATGKPLQPGEQALLDKLKGYDTSDLRVAGVVRAKGGATIEQFNITVARDSTEYKGVLSELEKFSVGRAKGIEDRQIVCDAFFAKTEPGVKPVLLTHDKGIYNRLLLMTGKDPAKLGQPVAKAFPAGFDVTVNGRTITVVPLPGS